MLSAVLVVAMFAAPPPEGTIVLESGEQLSGRLVEADVDKATFELRAGRNKTPEKRILSWDDVQTVNWLKGRIASPRLDSPVQAFLIDGTAIACETITLGKQVASLQTIYGPIEIRADRIERLEFQSREIYPGATPRNRIPRSKGIADSEMDRVFLRPAEAGQEKSTDELDVVEGKILEISDQVVTIRAEDEPIRLKKARVAQIQFAGRRAAVDPPGWGFIVDRLGNRIPASSFRFSGGKATVESIWKTPCVIEEENLALIDFSRSRFVFLGELEPRETEWRPRVPVLEDDLLTRELFRMRVDATPTGPFEVGGVSYRRGIWLPARSSVTYRVPPKFTRFKAEAAIDDRVEVTDSVMLRIECDSKVAFEKEIRSDSRSPERVDVDLKGVRSVRIIVDYAGSSAFADELDLLNARFVR